MYVPYRPIAMISSRQRLLVVIMVLMSVVAFAQKSPARQPVVIPLSNAPGASTALIIDSVRLTTDGHNRGVCLSFCLTGSPLQREQRVSIVPTLSDDSHQICLPAIEIYGNWAYYHYIRTGNQRNSQDTTALQYRERDVHAFFPYRQAVAFEPWMQLASLSVSVTSTDGCGNGLTHDEHTLLSPEPTYLYEREEEEREEIIEHLSGVSYVSFPVNKSVLLADFRNNREELQRLRNTIDSVSRDTTVEIRSVFIKGFASPEGSYADNDRLARRRTASLCEYIAIMCDISPMLIHIGYEAEDWQGLRRHVEASGRADRQALLSIIDSTLPPDDRLALIQREHPQAYRWLSQEVFPLLRHTDYQIDYTHTNITVHEGQLRIDTVYVLPVDTLPAVLPPETSRLSVCNPWLAVKTNVLYDLAVAPNIELEIPFGRQRRWSLLLEYCNPWWRWDRKDQSYEIQMGGVELRHWFSPRCGGGRPMLCGHFLGAYLASAKYDLEHNAVGDQGEVTSFGLTYGHAWPIARRLNLELSLSAGFMTGERRHYNAEFESTHLIYKYTKNLSYAGPTKLKLSLVYLIGKSKKKP